MESAGGGLTIDKIIVLERSKSKMKFTFFSIVLLLFALMLARPVSGGKTCQQQNLLLNRRIEGLSHRNRELLYTLNQKKSTACPRLESPTYGDTSIDGCNVGDTATTTCDKGYEVTGSAVRYCSSNGWLGTEADCVPVTCPPLEAPADGAVSTPDGLEFESEAIYTCNPGFELSGPNRRACLSTGLWSGVAPTCMPPLQCPALTPPVDGSVDVIGPQPVGTVATYMCDFGLVDGKVNRYCLADGTWSGIDPTCASDCEYGLLTYPHGDSFPSDGGCFLCTCNNGYVDCTTPICQRDPVVVQANQSSEDNNYRPAELALDYIVTTFSHTSAPENDTGNPWWKVEYECPHIFRGVTVWNRHNCCPTHLSNFTVYIDNQECGQVSEEEAPRSAGYKTIWCDPPLLGTSITIQKNEYERLFLAEVIPIFNCHYLPLAIGLQ